MHREGRTSLASQGSTKWGQTAEPEDSERIWEHCAAKGGEAGRKGNPTHLYRSSRGALAPSSHCCQHHLQLLSLGQNPSPQNREGATLGWV